MSFGNTTDASVCCDSRLRRWNICRPRFYRHSYGISAIVFSLSASAWNIVVALSSRLCSHELTLVGRVSSAYLWKLPGSLSVSHLPLIFRNRQNTCRPLSPGKKVYPPEIRNLKYPRRINWSVDTLKYIFPKPSYKRIPLLVNLA